MEASTNFCTHCGTPVGGEHFCTHCGAPLHHGSADSSSAPAEPNARRASGDAPEASATATAVREQPAPAPLAPSPQPPPAAGPAPQPSPPTRRGWLPIAISATVVLALAALVAVVLIATSGTPAAKPKNPQTQAVHLTNTLLASRQLYVATQQASYSALLPAGWQQVSTSASGLTAALTVQSPVDDGATITVGQVVHPQKALSGEGRAMLRAAGSQSGFHQDTSAATVLAGGRQAWAIAYDASGRNTATYLVSSCRNTYAVSATVPPGRVSVLRPRITIVAETLQGNC